MAVVANLDVYAPICRIEIEGEPLPTTAVIRVSVDESIDAPSKFDLTLNEGLDIKTQRFIWLENPCLSPGNKVEIYFGYAGKKSNSLFKGTIKALSPSFPSTGIPSLTVEGYDLSHTMQKKMTKVNDIDVKHSDIARELSTKYHLNSAGIEDSKKKYSKVERQKGEKDYNFLRRLANKSGFEFFLQGGTLYFRKPRDTKNNKKTVKTFQYRKNLISFSPRLSMASLISKVVVSGWNIETTKPIKVSLTLKDLGTGPDISSLEKLIKASEGPEPQVVEDKAFSSEDEAKDIAKVELKKAINNFIQGSLESIGDVDLRPGNNIKIEGLGEMFSGNYYIKSAKHIFGKSGYKTTLQVRRIVI
ncbi:MAG: phage late control D family protein [Desulfosarcina sp.]|nr:phage late control D family protein [Desulfobacterales bacterium]